jgi:excinuclease ABC subunit C
MKEILTRHYQRNKLENKKMPDLILVDGGLNQIIAAKESLDAIDVNIPIFGLYKNEKHQTSGVMDINGNTYSFENKSIFFLLTRMQDEVHRFAITFHKDLRKKKMTESILENIPGLGKKRIEILNKAYSDINALKEATLEELQQFLPLNVAINVYEKLHK